ncbi:MAG: FecR domain-containing protein [Alphaproteobacteria bacterium]|nr:FecR domain-containing protein [Alphaproteobacteria bacterium]
MAVDSETDRLQADQEATEWLLLVQEFPDDPDIQARFQAWLTADALHQAAWQETAQSYSLIGEAIGNDVARYRPSLRAGMDREGNKLKHSVDVNAGERGHMVGYNVSMRWIKRSIVGASATVLALFFSILYLPTMVLNLEADFTTSTGERRDVQLEDGSVVSLATESAISVDFQAGRRNVRLLSGRAYFEITPDPDHPFEVHAKGVTTTVLGTGFDEKLDEEGTVVAVRHGLVRVDYVDGGQPISETLKAGNWLSVQESGQIEKGEEVPEQIGIWQQGTLVAYDRPVSEIVNTLRPYYNGIIILASDDLGDLRVTGIYNLQQPAQAWEARAQAHQGLIVHTISPWVIVLNAR